MALFVRRRWPRWVAAAVVLLAVAGRTTVWLTHRDHRPSSPGPAAATAGSLPPDDEPPPSPIAQVLARAGGKIAGYDGMPVAASSVEVLSYVSGSAVFVGTPDARVLAVLVSADKVFQVKAGDRLTFTGAVRAVTREFAAALGLSNADLALVVRQGAYVEVTDFAVG
jgi:hypothetical protein